MTKILTSEYTDQIACDLDLLQKMRTFTKNDVSGEIKTESTALALNLGRRSVKRKPLQMKTKVIFLTTQKARKKINLNNQIKLND